VGLLIEYLEKGIVIKNRRGVIVLIWTVGWGKNVYKLCHCDFEASYKAEVIRGVGVIVPVVGAVTGYCTIEDGQ
jgi:hypothetical protein